MTGHIDRKVELFRRPPALPYQRYATISATIDGVRVGEAPDTDAGRACLGALLIEHLSAELDAGEK
jgi:hypothetical protein